jgi:hypothetical protein
MKRTPTMPLVDDEAEVEGFALGELWTTFTKAIEAGRSKEILNERADAWTAQYRNTSQPR